MTGEEADGSSTEQNDRMSETLKNTAQHIPMCLHELTLRQKLDIAVIRARAGLDQYRDTRGALDRRDHESLPALLRSIPQFAFELAQMIRRSRRFVGVAYIGIDLDREQVETWVQEHDLGLAFSDPGFLCGSASREVALDHGNSMLLRLLSCSGAPLWLNAPTADEQELIFAPGERFCIVRMERRRLEKHGRRWVVDAEEMYWPMQRLPHWHECDQ
jgi:hypothetical protein